MSASISPSASASPSILAPSDNYDVELFEENGIDLLQGLGANRDTVTPEEKLIIYSSTSLHPYVDDTNTLTLRISNNLVPGAVTVIDVFYALGA